MMRAAIVREAIDPARLIAEVSSDSNGAVALFLGTVRSANDGRAVSGIDYSAYDEMAAAEMNRILTEASERFGITDAAMEHRVGTLSIGDTSIGVAASHPHRGPVFDALRYIVDETKSRAPVWKLEHYEDGTREWVGAGNAPS
jgi:molybdopterin synthase catalytic subunit